MANRVLSETPTFVWFIFAGLLLLGVRRLSPRRTHFAVAAAAPIGFTAWSLVTIAGLTAAGHGMSVFATAAFGSIVGFASGSFRLVPGRSMWAEECLTSLPRAGR